MHTASPLMTSALSGDFGTADQYPVLCSVDTNEDGVFTSAEFGTQPQEASIPYVYFSQPEFTVGEADGTATVSVVMRHAPINAVTITVLCSDGTALSPDDYTPGNGVVLSFDSASAVDLLTTTTFTITIIDDILLEEAETIALSFDMDTLPFGVALAEPSMATVVILDDDLRSAYDIDNDSLIDVHTIEQLNAIHYDLNGDGEVDDTTSDDPAVEGSKAAAYVAVFYGLCPPDEVIYVGYELCADLDFAGTRWML